MDSVSRNQLCPCGSGKRYKHCCGSAGVGALAGKPFQPDWRDTMISALRSQKAGDLVGAEAHYRTVLDTRPDEPDALHMLGIICYETHRHAEALDLICRALDLTAWQIPSMYVNLGLVISAAISGNGLAQAARLRAAYARWKTYLGLHASKLDPLVSIVLPIRDSMGNLALESVYKQTYQRIEVVFVVEESRSLPQDTLMACPFPHKTLAAPGITLATAINQGVQHSTGEFINILLPGDRFDRRRIENMVRAVVHGGGEWGFSMLGFSGSDGQELTALNNQRVRIFAAASERIPGEDTTGFALLDEVNVLGSLSNLFFRRKIFDAVGGFASMPVALDRDFALSAIFEAEPFFVEEVLLNCCIDGLPGSRPNDGHNPEYDSNALKRFYVKAIAETKPRNIYAPVMSVWRGQFIRKVTSPDHLSLLPKDTIRKLVAIGVELLEAAESQGRGKLAGIDLVSYFSGEFGLAESAREIARSCLVGQIPFAARSIEHRVSHRCSDHSMDPWLEDHCRHTAIAFLLNPDTLKAILPQLSKNEITDCYKIGYWYWETERIPDQWQYAIDLLDEIWVATEFVAGAVRNFTTKPVVKIHPPINVPPLKQFSRSAFGLGGQRFLFLFSFDFGSRSARKNPYAAIRAFRAAFPPGRQDVGLVIKSHGGFTFQEQLRELQGQIVGDSRITLIDRMMSRDEVFGLQSICDAFVSLHRSEGLGLGIAESMAQGKPAIATAYSGNLEFMNGNNSCLVDYDLIPIRPGEYVYDQTGVSWADPDLDQAASYMRRLVDDKDYYQRISAAAKDEITLYWNYKSTADAIRNRLVKLELLTGC